MDYRHLLRAASMRKRQAYLDVLKKIPFLRRGPPGHDIVTDNTTAKGRTGISAEMAVALGVLSGAFPGGRAARIRSPTPACLVPVQPVPRIVSIYRCGASAAVGVPPANR